MSVRIVVTAGEPAGIGPDLLIQLAQSNEAVVKGVELLVVADPAILKSRAKALGLPLNIIPYRASNLTQTGYRSQLTVIDIPVSQAVRHGILQVNNSSYVLECLNRAIQGCLDHEFDGLVTGPVHKGIINDAGIHFSGHTEYLADKSNTSHVVMILATEGLRVALATTHLALKDVPSHINKKNLTSTLTILHQGLQQYFAIPEPCIYVCGLNPHAGEQGHLGREEINIIAPVLSQLRNKGMDLIGPLAADTLFTEKNLQHADAVLAMYHDQGLPVLKYKGFGCASNITLGLPFIRTSVDHGTALELAGSGKADTGSLITAINTAVQMSSNNKSTKFP